MKLEMVAKKYDISLLKAGLRFDERYILFTKSLDPNKRDMIGKDLYISIFSRIFKRERLPKFFFLDSEFILDAQDVYPFELLEYSKTVSLIHGENPFLGVSINHADIKREFEHDLRGALMKIKTMMLQGLSRRVIEGAFCSLYDLFDRTIRAILWLNNETPVSTKKDLKKVEELLSCSFPQLTLLLEKMQAKDAPALLKEVKLLITHFDRQ